MEPWVSGRLALPGEEEATGTPQEIQADVRVKEERLRTFLEREGLGAIVIGRQDHFAWLTCGGDSRVVTTSETGAALAVVTQERKYLLSYTMDGRRMLEEQAVNQGFEPVILRWHDSSLEAEAVRLAGTVPIGADLALAGALPCARKLNDLHYPLTDLELRRCRWVGSRSSAILLSVASWIEPGISEQEVAARLLYEFALSGMTIDVLITGFDDRVTRYRHPLPTGRRLERYALLHPAARRWGLHANVTRLVHFGPMAAHARKAIDAVIRIGAEVLAMLRPGLRFAEMLEVQKRLYRELGFGEEWRQHFQGGITGYTLADPTLCLDEFAVVRERQAFDYFITITGAKFEELTLLTEAGPEIASLDSGWPRKIVKTHQGPITVPDVLER
jgi:antitoxin VapB